MKSNNNIMLGLSREESIRLDHKKIFETYVCDRNTAEMKLLLEASEMLKKMIQGTYCRKDIENKSCHRQEAIELLLAAAKKYEIQKEILRADNYVLFMHAVALYSTKPEVLKLLLEVAKECGVQKEIFVAKDYELVKWVVSHETPEVLKLLLEAAKDCEVQKEIFVAKGYELLRESVCYRGTEVLKLLLEAVKECGVQKEIFAKKGYELVREAIPDKKTDVLKLLFTEPQKYDELQKQMIKKAIFSISKRPQVFLSLKFIFIFSMSDISYIKSIIKEHQNREWLKEIIHKAGKECKVEKEIFVKKSYELLREIVDFGTLAVLKLLLAETEKYPEIQKEILRADNYVLFKNAVSVDYAKQEVLKLLLEAAKECGVQKEILTIKGYELVKKAVYSRKQEVLKLLLEEAEKYPEVLKEMVARATIGSSYSWEVFQVLKFVEALSISDIIGIKSTIKEYQQNEWLKKIVHLSGDKAMKLMIRNADVEGIKLLSSLDHTCKKWEDLAKDCQKVIEPYLFDKTKIVELVQFVATCKDPIKEFKKGQKSDMKKSVIQFLVGGDDKYIPYIIKAIQDAHPKNLDKILDKYDELVQYNFYVQSTNNVIQHTEETVNNTEITTLGMVHNYDSEVG